MCSESIKLNENISCFGRTRCAFDWKILSGWILGALWSWELCVQDGAVCTYVSMVFNACGWSVCVVY